MKVITDTESIVRSETKTAVGKSLFRSVKVTDQGSKVHARLEIEGLTPDNYAVALIGNTLHISVVRQNTDGQNGIFTEKLVVPGLKKACNYSNYTQDGRLYVEILKCPGQNPIKYDGHPRVAVWKGRSKGVNPFKNQQGHEQ